LLGFNNNQNSNSNNNNNQNNNNISIRFDSIQAVLLKSVGTALSAALP